MFTALVLLFIISVSCFFAGFLKIITLGWGFSTISAPGVGVLHFLCAWAFFGGMVRLGID